jgi:hypothetical protein
VVEDDEASAFRRRSIRGSLLSLNLALLEVSFQGPRLSGEIPDRAYQCCVPQSLTQLKCNFRLSFVVDTIRFATINRTQD